MTDTLIIGAGLAGLVAGWRTAVSGERVTVIAKGWGATHWHGGCIDVLGGSGPLRDNLARLVGERPEHPYGLVGLVGIEEALVALQELCEAAGYPLRGGLDRNWLLSSAVGAVRPTCLAPATMTAGDLNSHSEILVVGFEQFVDFYPALIADNLSQQGYPAGHLTLDLPQLARRRTMNGVVLARLMGEADFRTAVIEAIRPHLGAAERVGFPAVFGNYKQAMGIMAELEAGLERAVFEIPGLPPSIPGIRLHDILKTAIERAGGRVHVGLEAIGAETENGRVTAVYTEAGARRRAHRYERYILATGGILGGGIVGEQDGRLREVVFDLPLLGPEGRVNWFGRDFVAAEGHPVYEAGVRVNGRFQPVDDEGQVVYENLFAAGTTLAGCDAIREKAFDGVGLVTGFGVAKRNN